MTTPHPDFNPDFDQVVRVSPDRVEQPEPEAATPMEFVAHLRLFKAGMMGTTVSMYSSYEGGYEATPVTFTTGEDPLVFRVDEDGVEQQIMFAAGYCFGWVEKVGGDVSKLRIWLVPHQHDENSLADTLA